MAYQALARKWRPRLFRELVGQDHVVRALTHALEFDRLHHAYLFTGTRGVGKTTVARILAKAMNCESRQGPDPCGECRVCRELDEGRFIDLVEVDAASRTKVEDTRELLENVMYAPTQGRYKVYLIDEAHMLSAHSFNALLKTLEEPPAHIKFLLATTDPQKIPVTVLSRCLQFNLKRLTPEQIRGQMESILHQEAVTFEANAVRSLARAADGSLRDGLSLMDQAIVHGGGALTEATVSAMLGTVARLPVFDLLDAIVARNAAALLAHIDVMAEHAPDFGDVLQQMLVILHHAALAQWAPEVVQRDEDAERILTIARSVRAEDIQLYYQIGLLGQRDLPLAPDPRMGFEMSLLRMLAFQPGGQQARSGSPSVVEPPEQAPGTASSSVRPAPRSAQPAPAAMPGAVSEPPAALRQMSEQVFSPAPPVSPAPSQEGANSEWGTLVRAMGLAAMTRELANNCTLLTLDQDNCILTLEPRLALSRSPRSEAALEKALQDHLNRPVKLHIRLQVSESETPAASMQRQKQERQQEAEAEISQDPTVRALQDQFDARIVPGSIHPID